MGRTRSTAATKRPVKKNKSNVAKSKADAPAPVPETELETQPLIGDTHYEYKAFIVFVNDPKLKTPFAVLQSSNIRCMESKKYVNDRFLNDDRRKRTYDLAFTNLFTFPCRVFAKALNTVTPVILHNKCLDLNAQFKVLMACNVDVETAYARLLEANPRKLTDDGLLYETGGNDDNKLLRPDTEPSYSDVDGALAHLQAKADGSNVNGGNKKKSEMEVPNSEAEAEDSILSHVSGTEDEDAANEKDKNEANEKDDDLFSEDETSVSPVNDSQSILNTPSPILNTPSPATSQRPTQGMKAPRSKYLTAMANRMEKEMKSSRHEVPFDIDPAADLAAPDLDGNGLPDVGELFTAAKSTPPAPEATPKATSPPAPAPPSGSSSTTARASAGFNIPSLFSASNTPPATPLSGAQVNSTKALWEEFANIRKALDKQWELSNKGFRTWRAELQEQTALIREMKHDLFNLKSQLYDSKAVSENLPHQDLNKLIPFRSDEDMITCLGNADLNNALFSKAIQIPVNSATFVNQVVDLLFHVEYMAIRSWPTTYGHSEKPKMPELIRPFMNSYIRRHVQDKMSPKTFMNGITRHITMATYKTTELGQVQLSLNAIASKKKRRSDKVNAMKSKIQLLKDKASLEGELSKTDKIKLSRLEFEHKHALADVTSLQEEYDSLKSLQMQKREEKKKRKDEIFHNEDDPENADEYLANLCGTHDQGEGKQAEERVVEYQNM